MAGKTVHEFEVKVTDGGSTAKVNNEVSKLHKNITDTQKAASRPANQTAAYVGAKAQTDSGLKRGSTGAGGGSEAKDFSRQAQGLGGLVHVYATFAANIFAVSAAFNALSRAADYSNMVAGLDQLGAASGRNLGYLAKDLVKATDGAVSLKEAMATVAQASSAGMDNTQIARLGELSKKAAQALGRDGAESLNRLTRGITKIEPELLDELGIFVRVDKAAADYARTIGKTASGLTEYERRQAFANAALDQAQKKFGAIDLPANQYSKLQASFIDLLYKGGELINKVLGPVVGLLNSSPLALGTVIAGFTGMLISKAIPAIGQWRQGLVDAAETAAKKADRMRESLKEYNMTKENRIISGHEAAARGFKEQALDYATKHKLFGNRSASMENLRGGDISTMDEQSRRKILNIEKHISAEKAKAIPTIQSEIDQRRVLLEALEIEKKKHQQIRAIASMAVYQDMAAASEVKKSDKTPLDERAREILAQRAARGAFASRTVSQVSEDIESRGYRGAWDSLNEKLEKNKADGGDEKLGKLGTQAVKARAGIVMLTSAVSTAMSVLSPYLMLIGLAVAAFQLLDSWLTSNSKEQTKFKESLDKSDTALKSLDSTLALIESRDPFERLSVDSLLARANALKEIGNSMKELIRDYQKMQESQNVWSGITDFISRAWGGNNEKQLSNKMAENIAGAAKGLPDTEAGAAVKKSLEEILGTTDFSKKGISKVLDEDKIEQATKLLDKYGNDSSRSLNNLKSAFDGLNEASKDYDNVINSLASSDPVSRMARNSAKAFSTLRKELGTAENQLAAFKEIAGDINKLRLLDPESAEKIIRANSSVNPKVYEARESIKAEALANFKNMEELYNRTPQVDELGNTSDREAAYLRVQEAKETYLAAEKHSADYKKKMQENAGIINEAFDKGAALAIKRIDQGVSLAFEKAKIDLSLALLNGVEGPEAIRERANLQRQEIDLGLRLIDSQLGLAISNERLRLVMEEASLVASPAGEIRNKLLEDNRSAQGIFTAGLSKDQLYKAIEAAARGGNSALTNLYGQMKGAQEQRVAANNKKKIVGINETQDITKDKFKMEAEGLSVAEKFLDTQISNLELQTKIAGIYSPALEDQRESLAVAKETLKLRTLENKLLEAGEIFKDKYNKASDEGKKSLLVDFQRKAKEYTEGVSQLEAEATLRRTTGSVDKTARELEYKKKLVSEEEKYLDLQMRSISLLEEVGVLDKADVERAKTSIEQKKRQNQFELEIAEIMKDYELANKDIIAEKVKKTTDLYNATEKVTQAERRYQQALLDNVQLLKSLEERGSYGSEYFGAVADNFSNKLSQLIKTSKTAAEVFNDGLINMIDKTIDKFYELMQRSELTLKDMVFFARNALSDVFRDAASQTMKNAWKETLKGSGLLPETEADKALKEAKTANQYLMDIKNNTAIMASSKEGLVPGSTGGTEDPNNYGYDYTGNVKSAQAISYSADTLSGTVDSFVAGSKEVLAGNKSVMSLFGDLIKNLGSTLLSFIDDLGNTLSSMVSSASVGIPQGIENFFSGITGGGYAPTGLGGDGMELMFSKGGALSSSNLSAYSNSIVTSPTYFAKGGNVMGEAGPEAIIPLKRDSKGNLGVSGASGSNNIEININISQGEISGNSVSGDANSTAGQLGNIIKQVVGQELIKQTRPGGLLAR